MLILVILLHFIFIIFEDELHNLINLRYLQFCNSTIHSATINDIVQYLTKIYECFSNLYVFIAPLDDFDRATRETHSSRIYNVLKLFKQLKGCYFRRDNDCL